MVSGAIEQQNTVLVDGKLLSGDKLKEYAQLKGLCPICVQTVTMKRVRKKFGGLRRGLEWEPLTLTDDVAGNYTVYKGYCLQPTCWTLEEVQVKLGEKPAAKQKKPRRKKSPSQRRTSRRPSKQSVALSVGPECRAKLESSSFMEKKPLKLIDEGELIEETVRSLSARSADGAGFRQTRASLYVTPTKYNGSGLPMSDRSAHRRPTFSSTSPGTSAELGLDLTDASDDLSISSKRAVPSPALGADFHRPSYTAGSDVHRMRNRRVSRRHTEFSKDQKISEHQPLTLASLCAAAERADQESRRLSATDPDRRPSHSSPHDRGSSYQFNQGLGSNSAHAAYSYDDYAPGKSSIQSLLGRQLDNAPRADKLQIMKELLALYTYDEDDTAATRDSSLWNKLKSSCNSQVDLYANKENNNKHFQLLLRVIKESSRGATHAKAWELLAMVMNKKRLHMDSNHQLTMNFFQAISSVLDTTEESDDNREVPVKQHATKVLFYIIRLEEHSASSIFTNMIAMLERSRRLEWVASLLDRLMFSESECDDKAESLFVVWKLLQLQSLQARDTGSVTCEEEMLMMTMIVGMVDSMLSGTDDDPQKLEDTILKAQSSLGLLGFVASHAGATALAERQQECIISICRTLLTHQADSVIVEGCMALCTILPLSRWEDQNGAKSEVKANVIDVVVQLLGTENKQGARPFTSSGKGYRAGVLACQILTILLQQIRQVNLDECRTVVFTMVELLNRSSNVELTERLSETLVILLGQDSGAREHLHGYPEVSLILLDCLKRHSSSGLVQEKVCHILQELVRVKSSSVSSDLERCGGIDLLTSLLQTGPNNATLHEAIFQLLNDLIPMFSDTFLMQSGTQLVNTILSVVESNASSEVVEAGSMALSALLTEVNKTEK